MEVAEPWTAEDLAEAEQSLLRREAFKLLANRRPADLGFRPATFSWIVETILETKEIGRESEEAMWWRLEAGFSMHILKIDGLIARVPEGTPDPDALLDMERALEPTP